MDFENPLDEFLLDPFRNGPPLINLNIKTKRLEQNKRVNVKKKKIMKNRISRWAILWLMRLMLP